MRATADHGPDTARHDGWSRSDESRTPRRPDATAIAGPTACPALCRGEVGRHANPGATNEIQSRAMKVLWSGTIVVAVLAVVSAQPARRSVALVVVGGTVITENAARAILSPGAVAIDGADIVEVGTPGAIAAKYQPVETLDARDEIVLPGLINTHT